MNKLCVFFITGLVVTIFSCTSSRVVSDNVAPVDLVIDSSFVEVPRDTVKVEQRVLSKQETINFTKEKIV
mgnify:CR=1 FL=1